MSKVAIGMSGGVDSSVAVHLLQAQGHEVVGIHMLLTPGSSRDAQAAKDAAAVARAYGIDFHILEAQDLFREEVIAPFADSYLYGETPNPCVRCNQRIKFGALWREAQRLGCTMLATGHYARILATEDGPRLARAVDPAKDQSYFLWGIPREMLAHILFPLGDYHKDQVRAIAAELGLATAQKKESQEICFIADDDYARFLSNFCPDRLPGDGDFVDAAGTVLGRHHGAWRYTIGQRRGLGLALGHPAYVTATDPAHNTVRVGRDAELWHEGLTARQVGAHTDATSGTALIKIRSRDQGTPGRWHIDNAQLVVQFDTPVRAITPGQSVVLYDEADCVILGGIIDAPLLTSRKDD
ncbi:MAG: tRNA 2-thiouridine(34) synthase MnmA [Peptococcaceae bacterium]|nr:tRNA 2-thiouridine(34) synthase MnmA [Peptococcaceae bacterium]